MSAQLAPRPTVNHTQGQIKAAGRRGWDTRPHPGRGGGPDRCVAAPRWATKLRLEVPCNVMEPSIEHSSKNTA